MNSAKIIFKEENGNEILPTSILTVGTTIAPNSKNLPDVRFDCIAMDFNSETNTMVCYLKGFKKKYYSQNEIADMYRNNQL